MSLAVSGIGFAMAGEASEKDAPSVYIVEVGGYGVFAPRYEGAKSYIVGFRPIFDIHEAGDRVWYSTPDDAFTIDLFETSNFRFGLAGDFSLQSRYHNENIDFRIGKAELVLLGGVFAEFYPVSNLRTRVEVLQAVTGYEGMTVNLSADYIWKPTEPLTLSIGPRLQFVDDNYASDLFSTRVAIAKKKYVKYNAEGGVHSAGAQLTGNYDWTSSLSTKFFVNYSELLGDASDSPRVDLKGSSSQFTVGIGASYKFEYVH
jgi:outer membrane protein